MLLIGDGEAEKDLNIEVVSCTIKAWKRFVQDVVRIKSYRILPKLQEQKMDMDGGVKLVRMTMDD